jgi:DNA-binding NarL/FixJ family response regulator
MNFTDRQLEILRMMGDGNLVKQIASKLHLSEKTIKNHTTRIYEKLRVDNRTSAVVVAIQDDILDPKKLSPARTHEKVTP